MTAVVLVPAITALAFSGLRVQAELAAADDFDHIVSQVDASVLITEVVHQLQAERSMVGAAVADGTAGTDERVQDQFQKTDAAIDDLRDRIGELELSDQDTEDRYEYAFDQLSQLAPLRNLAKASTYPDLAVLSAYNSVVDPLVQLGREITTAGYDTGEAPSRLSLAVQTLGQAKERAARLDALLLVSAVADSFRSGSVQNQARAAAAGFDASVADFMAVATPDEQQRYNDGYSGPEVDRRRAFAQAALTSPDPTASLDIDVATLRDTSTTANNRLRAVETTLIGSLRGQASGLASAATATAWQVAMIVLGALVVTLLLMFAMAQTLLDPLRRLRRGALKVARTTLPMTIDRILADPDRLASARHAIPPMPVHTSEEIGQVARSFDAVHERAVRLATEQAVLRENINDLFVNLSRRSQALVERQLSELDKLEQGERDPDQLAHLFVLDHLAARMRRNSENLLILSGVGVPRRSAKPVSITEVIAAAQSEIENYARVVVNPGPGTVVLGRVVNDVVHLMAELLDNATTFAPADTKVTVTAAHVRTGELAVQITDQGPGMSDEELADINQRLSDPPPFDLAVSRRMGLYVVARLAKQHGIRVRLHGDFNTGTSAVVVLPKELTAAEPAPALTMPLNVQPTVQPTAEPTAPVPVIPEPTTSSWFDRAERATDSEPVEPPVESPAAPMALTGPDEDGWAAVRRKLGETAQQAALPRRSPGSNLLPGSVGERRLNGRVGSQPDR
ncbi:MAG TPA: nitrate- and nitrite sensing domain-containing protein [Actinophytocola sp.]|nr:nitrate- and nitrite sensing domain-containing protein [Actinophytocola sp.]